MDALGISIRAPHAGSDAAWDRFMTDQQNFNPRSPCGERPADLPGAAKEIFISIHAPHAGSD